MWFLRMVNFPFSMCLTKKYVPKMNVGVEMPKTSEIVLLLGKMLISSKEQPKLNKAEMMETLVSETNSFFIVNLLLLTAKTYEKNPFESIIIKEKKSNGICSIVLELTKNAKKMLRTYIKNPNNKIDDRYFSKSSLWSVYLVGIDDPILNPINNPARLNDITYRE